MLSISNSSQLIIPWFAPSMNVSSNRIGFLRTFVTKPTQKDPCIPYEMTGPQKTGFFSGFHPIDVISNEVKTSFIHFWHIHFVQSVICILIAAVMEPYHQWYRADIFLLCSSWIVHSTRNGGSDKSCKGKIYLLFFSPPFLLYCYCCCYCYFWKPYAYHLRAGCWKRVQNETETIAVQRAYAKNSSYMLNPGEPFPAEASSVVTLTQAPTSTSPATATTSSALLSATPVPPSRPQGLSSAAVAGIVVGTIVALMLLGALFVYIDRTRSSGSGGDGGPPQELDGEAGGAQQHGEAGGAQPRGEASGAQPYGFVPIATRLPEFGRNTNQARQGYSPPSGSNVSELGSPTSGRNIMSPMSVYEN